MMTNEQLGATLDALRDELATWKALDAADKQTLGPMWAEEFAIYAEDLLAEVRALRPDL